MHTLAVARHGAYDPVTGSLTDDGRAQVMALANKLELVARGRNILVAAAASRRTHESGQIIANQLGVPLETDPFPCAAESTIPDAREYLDGHAGEKDLIVFVGHDWHVRTVPALFVPGYLAIAEDRDIAFASSAIVDCEHRTVVII